MFYLRFNFIFSVLQNKVKKFKTCPIVFFYDVKTFLYKTDLELMEHIIVAQSALLCSVNLPYYQFFYLYVFRLAVLIKKIKMIYFHDKMVVSLN